MDIKKDKTDNLFGKTSLNTADQTIMTNLVSQIILFIILFPFFLLLRKKLRWLYTPNISKRTKHPLYNHRGWFNWFKPLYSLEDPELLYLIGLDSFIFLVTLRMIIKIFVFLSLIIGLPLCILYYFNPIIIDEENNNTFIKLSILSIGDNKMIYFLGMFLMYAATLIISYFLYIQTKKLVFLRQIYIQNPSLLTSIYQLKKIEWKLQSKTKMLDYINTPTKTVIIKNLPHSIKNKNDYKVFLEELNLGSIENMCLLKDSKKLENLINLQRKIVRRIEFEFQSGYNDLRKFVKNRISEIRKDNENFSKKLVEKEDEKFINNNGSLNTDKHTSDLFVYSEEEKKKLFFNFIRNEKLKVFGRLNLFVEELREVMEKINLEVTERENNEDIISNTNTDNNTTTNEANNNTSNELNDVLPTKFLTYKELLKTPSTLTTGKPSTGFVTYKDRNSAAIASQCLISDKPFECHTELAQQPSDICWDNLNTNNNIITILRFISSFIFILYSLFFLFIVVFIIGLIDIDVLLSVLKKFNVPSDWENIIKVTVDGILAPLLFNTFLSLSAFVIKIFIKMESRSSYSHEQRQLMKKHMNFLIYEIILGSYLGTSIVSTIFAFVDTQNFDFKAIISQFGLEAVKVSLFFTNIVIQRSLVGLLSILMKYGSLFKILCVPFTTRDKLEYRRAPAIDYGLLYPAIIIVMPMCLINLIMAPVLIFLGLFYFTFVYFIHKHEFLYSLINEFESGGTHWWFFSNFIFNIILLTQFITFCFFLNSNSKILSLLFIPLFIMTYYFSSSLLAEIKLGFANLPLKVHDSEDRNYKWEWNYDLEIERDALDINLIYKSHSEYIYEDLSVGRIYNRILLPDGFFRSIKYIKKNDTSGILGFNN